MMDGDWDLTLFIPADAVPNGALVRISASEPITHALYAYVVSAVEGLILKSKCAINESVSFMVC